MKAVLSALKARLAEQGLTNVRLIKMNDTETPLPPQFCDLVLVPSSSTKSQDARASCGGWRFCSNLKGV